MELKNPPVTEIGIAFMYRKPVDEWLSSAREFERNNKSGYTRQHIKYGVELNLSELNETVESSQNIQAKMFPKFIVPGNTLKTEEVLITQNHFWVKMILKENGECPRYFRIKPLAMETYKGMSDSMAISGLKTIELRYVDKVYIPYENGKIALYEYFNIPLEPELGSPLEIVNSDCQFWFVPRDKMSLYLRVHRMEDVVDSKEKMASWQLTWICSYSWEANESLDRNAISAITDKLHEYTLDMFQKTIADKLRQLFNR